MPKGVLFQGELLKRGEGEAVVFLGSIFCPGQKAVWRLSEGALSIVSA